MHQCPGIWFAIGRAVVYYARDIHTLRVEIKCWHCTLFQMIECRLEGAYSSMHYSIPAHSTRKFVPTYIMVHYINLYLQIVTL